MMQRLRIFHIVADDWRRGLEVAIKDSGNRCGEYRSQSGKGPGYLHSVFVEEKEPTLSNLLKICRAADDGV